MQNGAMSGPRDLLGRVRCFLFDMDGTIFLEDHLLLGAAELIASLEAQGMPFYFITNNSSRSKADYVAKFARMDLPVGQEHFFTSGEATALYLQKLKPRARLYVVGTPSLEEEFRGFGFHLTDEDPDFAVLGFDTTLTYAKLWKLCDLVRAGLAYIATHPDINCPTDSGFMPDIGAMMALVEASTGRRPDAIIGKPNLTMVTAILEKTGLAPADLVMVGDRLYTDIALGQAGILTVLVLSGETQESDLAGSPFRPDLVCQNVGELYRMYKAVKDSEKQ